MIETENGVEEEMGALDAIVGEAQEALVVKETLSMFCLMTEHQEVSIETEVIAEEVILREKAGTELQVPPKIFSPVENLVAGIMDVIATGNVKERMAVGEEMDASEKMLVKSLILIQLPSVEIVVESVVLNEVVVPEM